MGLARAAVRAEEFLMTRRFFKLGGLIVLATGCSAMTSPDKSQTSVASPGGAAGATAAGAGNANGGASGGSGTAGSHTGGAGVGGSRGGSGGG